MEYDNLHDEDGNVVYTKAKTTASGNVLKERVGRLEDTSEWLTRVESLHQHFADPHSTHLLAYDPQESIRRNFKQMMFSKGFKLGEACYHTFLKPLELPLGWHKDPHFKACYNVKDHKSWYDVKQALDTYKNCTCSARGYVLLSYKTPKFTLDYLKDLGFTLGTAQWQGRECPTLLCNDSSPELLPDWFDKEPGENIFVVVPKTKKQIIETNNNKLVPIGLILCRSSKYGTIFNDFKEISKILEEAGFTLEGSNPAWQNISWKGKTLKDNWMDLLDTDESVFEEGTGWVKLDRDLTEADIGKKVRLASGIVDELVENPPQHSRNLVKLRENYWRKKSGRKHSEGWSFDTSEIVEILEKPVGTLEDLKADLVAKDVVISDLEDKIKEQVITIGNLKIDLKSSITARRNNARSETEMAQRRAHTMSDKWGLNFR